MASAPTPNGVVALPPTRFHQLKCALLIPVTSQPEAWRAIPSTSDLNINLTKQSIRLSFAREKDRSVWAFYGAGLDMADSTLHHIAIELPSQGLSVKHRPLEAHEAEAFKSFLSDDDAADFRVVQIKLDDGHNTTVTGFGLPFHGVTMTVNNWVNNNSLIYGAASLTDILQQRNFTLLIKATDAQILAFIQDSKVQKRVIDYGHGDVHTWDMKRYAQQIPRNRGPPFEPKIRFHNANQRDTALTQMHVQDVWDFDDALQDIAETEFVCLIEPKGLFVSTRIIGLLFITDINEKKSRHWRAARRALSGEMNKLKVTFTEREHKRPNGTKFEPVTWEAVHLAFGSSDHLRGVNVKDRIPLSLKRPQKGQPGHDFSPIAHDDYQATNERSRRDALEFHCQSVLHGETLRVGAINSLSSLEIKPEIMKQDDLVLQKQVAFNELLIGQGLWDVFSQGLSVNFPPFDLLHGVPAEMRKACLELVYEDDRERVQKYFGKLHLGLGLVSGPPGTGKSHLASIIVMLMLFNHTIEHVYVSAASNGATDNILDRIHDVVRTTTIKLMDNDLDIKHPMLVRGYSLNLELGNCLRALTGLAFAENTLWSPSPWRFDRSLCWWTLRALGSPTVPPLTSDDNTQLWELHQSLNALKSSTSTSGSRFLKFKRLVQLAQGLETFADYRAGHTRETHDKTLSQLMGHVVKCANVVATTPVTSTTWLYNNFNSEKARAVVFDEAATMFCADGLLVFGNTPRPMIAVRDPKQLAPVLPTASEMLHGRWEKHDRSLLESRFPVNRFAQFAEISWLSWFIRLGWPVFQLHTQHRMAEGLFDLSLNAVYHQLKPHFKYSALCHPTKFPIGIQVEHYMKEKFRIPIDLNNLQPVFFDCLECPCRNYPDSASRLNPRQADCMAKVLVGLMTRLSLSPADIAVLTPYRANLNAIGKRFKKNNKLKDIVCSTIDKYQGREAQIIVLALCVTQETGPSSVANQRRLNVALTRHRSSLLIFGDIDTTVRKFESGFHSDSDDEDSERIR
ncbi:hypothetical protein FSARC_3452 [Fusarium sarcochroum]|uniref:DNA2/NAM7 helicase-like C-terminal domain-containing protein n=1 Tax=Fusarium sarcochroum TaxID=1208366 RepID=A0A8H4U419_9HYPO|nr:hypothetical protein FSARC_3452 [Fusarium sarcochroum]